VASSGWSSSKIGKKLRKTLADILVGKKSTQRRQQGRDVPGEATSIEGPALQALKVIPTGKKRRWTLPRGIFPILSQSLTDIA